MKDVIKLHFGKCRMSLGASSKLGSKSQEVTDLLQQF